MTKGGTRASVYGFHTPARLRPFVRSGNVLGLAVFGVDGEARSIFGASTGEFLP